MTGTTGTQLWIVRHGQASWDGPDYDQLSPLGADQCRRLGAQVRATGHAPAAAVVGALRRHRQSWAAFAAAGGTDVEPVVDPGWDEYDHDDVLRVRWPELPDHAAAVARARAAPDPRGAFLALHDQAAAAWTAAPAGTAYTEPFAAFTSRVLAAFDRVVETARAATGAGPRVVLTSGGVVAAVVSHLLAGDQRLWPTLSEVVRNSGLTRVAVGRRDVGLVSFNEHGHLPATALTLV